ncbi:MAG: aminotransferase class I/II-fold pyridoxal phosphate-dependent enzyme [Intestinibacillus sp.]
MLSYHQNAPLYEALQALAARDTLRFHMPGHKGKPIFEAYASVFALDFTETYDTGNLYEGIGPIREAERCAADYYGAADCHFLTGGSTQGVQAMLCAAAAPGGAVLLDRTAHKSAVSACALFDLTPHFVYPPPTAPFGFGGLLSLTETEEALRAHPEIQAVLVVSPNYYGVLQDIPALAALCHQYGKRLLVDAAHGAHLPAVGIPSPVAQGADAAVLSAHKTLPCLGQGALVLLGEGMDGGTLRAAESMVGTSSPSYTVMASIDLARAWLEGEGGSAYARAAKEVTSLRAWLRQNTVFRPLEEPEPNLDPCRLTLCCAHAGLTGHALADRLYEQHGVACEMADDRNVVFIITGADSTVDLFRLRRALHRCSHGLRPAGDPDAVPDLPRAARVLTVRDAWFSPRRAVPVNAAENLICARPVTPYPPGIPVLWPGEKITAAHIEFLTKRCYTTVREIETVSR